MSDSMSLARRAVACRGWRWMPGMETTTGHIVGHDDILSDVGPGAALPRLDAPPTLGCLLALVRESHNDPSASCAEWMGGTHFGGWAVTTGDRSIGTFATEAEALVAALAEAP